MSAQRTYRGAVGKHRRICGVLIHAADDLASFLRYPLGPCVFHEKGKQGGGSGERAPSKRTWNRCAKQPRIADSVTGAKPSSWPIAGGSARPSPKTWAYIAPRYACGARSIRHK